MVVSKAVSVALLSVLLGGCPQGGAITCPTFVKYSKAFLQQANVELEMIEAKAPNVVQLVNDYGVERDAIRKCIALRAKARK